MLHTRSNCNDNVLEKNQKFVELHKNRRLFFLKQVSPKTSKLAIDAVVVAHVWIMMIFVGCRHKSFLGVWKNSFSNRKYRYGRKKFFYTKKTVLHLFGRVCKKSKYRMITCIEEVYSGQKYFVDIFFAAVVCIVYISTKNLNLL